MSWVLMSEGCRDLRQGLPNCNPAWWIEAICQILGFQSSPLYLHVVVILHCLARLPFPAPGEGSHPL